MSGSASHLLLDGLEAWSPAIEIPAHLVGLLAMLTLAAVLGRRRLVCRWHGPAPSVVRSPVLYWTAVVAVAAPGLAVVPFLPAAALPHTTGVRVLTAVATGLLAAAAVTGRGAPGHRLTATGG